MIFRGTVKRELDYYTLANTAKGKECRSCTQTKVDRKGGQ